MHGPSVVSIYAAQLNYLISSLSPIAGYEVQAVIAAQVVGVVVMYAHVYPSFFFYALQNANLSESVAKTFDAPITIELQPAAGTLQFVVEVPA